MAPTRRRDKVTLRARTPWAASSKERGAIGAGGWTAEGLLVKSLPIVWQRLVSPDGKTCDCCSATYQEMQQAVSKLKERCRLLSIEPMLEVREIDQESFEANLSELNRIWIAGRPMEVMARATVGSSRCCSVCGESACRNVGGEGTTFETIPENLFLRAALIASSQLLDKAGSAVALRLPRIQYPSGLAECSHDCPCELPRPGRPEPMPAKSADEQRRKDLREEIEDVHRLWR